MDSLPADLLAGLTETPDPEKAIALTYTNPELWDTLKTIPAVKQHYLCKAVGDNVIAALRDIYFSYVGDAYLSLNVPKHGFHLVIDGMYLANGVNCSDSIKISTHHYAPGAGRMMNPRHMCECYCRLEIAPTSMMEGVMMFYAQETSTKKASLVRTLQYGGGVEMAMREVGFF
jgi:hypothetical protein